MKVRFDAEVAATVAYASSCVLISERFAGANVDRQAELLAAFAPHIQAAIHSYCEAVCGVYALPTPSRN